MKRNNKFLMLHKGLMVAKLQKRERLKQNPNKLKQICLILNNKILKQRVLHRDKACNYFETTKEYIFIVTQLNNKKKLIKKCIVIVFSILQP